MTTAAACATPGRCSFTERLPGKVEKLDPYDEDGAQRVPNDVDGIYHEAGGQSAIVQTKALDPGDPSAGYRGTMILGVDPGAQPA